MKCMENSFQFDAVGCVGTYIGHEESCREVFCVFRGYYPCSGCHLFMYVEQSITAYYQFFRGGFGLFYVECQISGSMRPHVLSNLLVCDGVAVEGK